MNYVYGFYLFYFARKHFTNWLADFYFTIIIKDSSAKKIEFYLFFAAINIDKAIAIEI